MEILEILDVLEDKVEKARNIPIINRAIIDKEDLIASIQDIRLRLPEDLKQARWIKDDRKRILAEAQQEADAIIKQGEEKAAELVEENAITKRAHDQAAAIVSAAMTNSRNLRAGARQYVNDILAKSEATLNQSQEALRRLRVDIHNNAEDSESASDTNEQ